MKVQNQIAKHFREIHFGGNWTVSNVKDQLKDVSWEEANKKIDDLNTILILSVHMKYYVSAVLRVLQGGALVAKDELSFTHNLQNQEDWDAHVHSYLEEAEELAGLIENLSEEEIYSDFTDSKYGSYYRNLHGIVEHTHYHLGQISLIKKFIRKD